jgi:hypothetical protein
LTYLNFALVKAVVPRVGEFHCVAIPHSSLTPSWSIIRILCFERSAHVASVAFAIAAMAKTRIKMHRFIP